MNANQSSPTLAGIIQDLPFSESSRRKPTLHTYQADETTKIHLLLQREELCFFLIPAPEAFWPVHHPLSHSGHVCHFKDLIYAQHYICFIFVTLYIYCSFIGDFSKSIV
ncbi:hypothetical protein T12_14127 [Trichinella patagoniensis]|uniref:Uncharacterized protein n=1 Tax=Trichinella patagoniensis TaxID=990121 RepID=A0A0V0ZNG7_9BILA|nr:hypothetical protein T12_14127 [Trichinella patagoniensis]